MNTAPTTLPVIQVASALEFSAGTDSLSNTTSALTNLQNRLNELLAECNDPAATVVVTATTTSAGVYWLGTINYMANLKANELPQVMVHFGVEYADGMDAVNRANDGLERLQAKLNEQLDQETPDMEPEIDIMPFSTNRGLFFLGVITYSPII